MRLVWEDHHPVDFSPSAEDEFFTEQESDPLDLLTDKQRFVIELRFGVKDGFCYTQREIASLMGVSQKTVWKHEKAAIKRLEVVNKGRQSVREHKIEADFSKS